MTTLLVMFNWKVEYFSKKFKATSEKEVYELFEQFKTDGFDMSKLDHLRMQKSKSFYHFEKKKGLSIYAMGLIYKKDWEEWDWKLKRKDIL